MMTPTPRQPAVTLAGALGRQTAQSPPAEAQCRRHQTWTGPYTAPSNGDQQSLSQPTSELEWYVRREKPQNQVMCG